MGEAAGTVDVREAFDADPLPALVPGRFRKPLVHVEDQAAPAELLRELGSSLYHRRDLLKNFGDQTRDCFVWELMGFEDAAPGLAAKVRKVVFEKLTAEALEAIGVPEFDLGTVDVIPLLFHHGGHYQWHDDWMGADDPAVTRRVAFDLFLHSAEKQFSGGELDFPCGEQIEPETGRLVFRHPLQLHRIAPVECRSAETVHGRWSISGWIHGAPPDGWVERVDRLRCAPED